MAELPAGWDAIERIALDGRWITPGLIDCHTHLVYAGDRAHEFELRLAGASYEDIARAGGGIVSTVKATRAASEDDLVRLSLPRLDRLLAEGVTTVEIKSGYGLDRDSEMRMLRAARRLARGARRRRSHELSRRARPAAGSERRQGALHRRGLRDDSGHRPRTACRCGRCILRDHCLLARADGARVRGRAGGRPAGQAACRPAHQPQWRKARGRAWRAVRRPSRIYRRGWRRGHGTRRHRRGPAARRVLCAAGEAGAAGRRLAATARADGNRHRQQSRHLADHLTAHDPQHGGDAVSPHRRRSHRRRNAGSGARARPARRNRHARAGKWCDLAIWDIERPAELAYRIGFNPLHRRVRRGR